jgi:hypothetical protein
MIIHRKGREVIFFVLIFLTFYVANSLREKLLTKFDSNKDIITLSVGALFTVAVIGYYFLAKLHSSSESFWDVSAFSQCKGGPYFWQGNSATAKMCRALAETPEGRIGISSYNCPTGQNGQPGFPFVYSPISDDDWENSMCDKPTCTGSDVGLCGDVKQVE